MFFDLFSICFSFEKIQHFPVMSCFTHLLCFSCLDCFDWKRMIFRQQFCCSCLAPCLLATGGTALLKGPVITDCHKKTCNRTVYITKYWHFRGLKGEKQRRAGGLKEQNGGRMTVSRECPHVYLAHNIL